MSQAIRRNWMYLLPAIGVVLLYLPSLGFGLVWDDTIFLRDIPLYREMGEFGEAERILLDNVLPLNPDQPVAYLNLGILNLRADRPDLASLALQDALALLSPDMKYQAEEFLRQVDDPQRWLQMAESMLAIQSM